MNKAHEMMLEIETLIGELKKEVDTIHNCTECDGWDQAKEFCMIFKAVPPIRVLVVGCGNFSQSVPF